MSRPATDVAMPGDSTSIGIESAWAVPTALARLSTPGPLVATHTPGPPPLRAYPSAAYPAPCSCRGRMCSIDEAARCR